MACHSERVLIRHVEVLHDGRFGGDYVTLGTLRNGLNRTRRKHWRLMSESAPLSERAARLLGARREGRG